MRQDHARRPFFHDDAAVHEHDAVPDFAREAQLMGHGLETCDAPALAAWMRLRFVRPGERLGRHLPVDQEGFHQVAVICEVLRR